MSTQSNRRQARTSDEVLIALSGAKSHRLSEQLERELRNAIQAGRLGAGAQLPASRMLARDLGVSRSVVVRAYEQLVTDGYLASRQGAGTFVNAQFSATSASAQRTPKKLPTARFVGGLPDPALFPRGEWRRSYDAALRDVADSALTYPGAGGGRPLRDALSSYVARVRGVHTSPGRLVITSGFTQALVLLCRALRSRGVRAIAVEDPCFGFHRRAITATGVEPVPIPVDDDGLVVSQLHDAPVGAVLVAPAHSYPTGAVLSPGRRASLVAWARRHQALVIEDDYDAEFRYDRKPIGALQGLDPERIAYGGCASKTLTPALRLGWLAVPGWLIGDVLREKALDDLGTGLLEQLALARFLERGAFARHLRRVRPIYRERREAALSALAEFLPSTRVTGIAAGLHVYVRLPAGCREQDLVEAAGERGVLVEGAAWHWAAPETAQPGLVIGYGSSSVEAIRRGLRVLGAAYAQQGG